jgi:uncharacterized Rossmann fold enzyme
MDYKVWEPYYLDILSDFGFDKEDDEHSARILSKLMKDKLQASAKDLISIIAAKDIVVVGGSKDLDDELSEGISGERFIAADGTTSNLLAHDIIPDIIVTDLDGEIQDQISANSMGALVAIHAHGDNIPQVEKWTPRFTGKVLGTTQCKPPSGLYNFGGFTDGDRGVFMAHHFGARRIRLLGFDFKNVGDKPNCNKEMKLEKLKWAKKLISLLGISEVL